MLIDSIRELNRTAPFQPYQIRLTSGTVHRVPHPDFIFVSPKGSWMIVTDEKEYPHWISSLLVEEVTTLPAHRNGRRRRKGT